MATARQAGLGDNRVASSATWTTSSRVGASTIACGPFWPGSSRQVLKKGITNAAVFPVPVWAWPMTSRPVSASGMKAA
jgi:hypothetical protein